MRRVGLGAKFISLIACLLIVIFSLVTIVLVRLNTNSLRSNLINDSKAFAALATEPIGKTFLTYQDSGRIRIKEAVQRFTDLDMDISNVTIVDTNGVSKFSQDKDKFTRLSPEQAASFEPQYIYTGHHNLSQVIQPFIEDFGAHRYSLVYDISSQKVQAAVTHVITTILFFVLMSLIISIGLSYMAISYLFINPLKRVSRQAVAISGGQLDQQIRLYSDDEISDLAKSVNTMAQSLKDDIAKLKETDRLKTEFMIIASHNLRTPLSVINGYLEQAEDVNNLDGMRNVLNVIGTRSKQLGVFAEDILMISSIEAGRDLLGFEPMNLHEFLKAIAAEFKQSAEQKGIDFKISLNTQEHHANISPAHMRSAIWNLLDNALKFTKKGGSIEFGSSIEGNKAKIYVKDTGIGIAVNEIPKLFTKFHRGTDLIQYEYEGTGIGLYASKLVVDQHKGKIKIESELGKGSTFTITLPLLDK